MVGTRTGSSHVGESANIGAFAVVIAALQSTLKAHTIKVSVVSAPFDKGSAAYSSGSLCTVPQLCR